LGWVSQAGFSSGGGAPGADGDGAAGQAQAGGPGAGRVHIESGAQGKCPLIPGVCLPWPKNPNSWRTGPGGQARRPGQGYAKGRPAPRREGGEWGWWTPAARVGTMVKGKSKAQRSRPRGKRWGCPCLERPETPQNER